MDRYHEHINTSYASLKNARAVLNSLHADEGYIMTVLHTRRVGNKKEGGIKAVTLQCSCAPKVTASLAFNKCNRVRSRRGTGCMFKCSLRRVEQEDHWEVQVGTHDHNHGPFTDQSVHPYGRALTEEQRKEVIQAAVDDQNLPE